MVNAPKLGAADRGWRCLFCSSVGRTLCHTPNTVRLRGCQRHSSDTFVSLMRQIVSHTVSVGLRNPAARDSFCLRVRLAQRRKVSDLFPTWRSGTNDQTSIHEGGQVAVEC